MKTGRVAIIVRGEYDTWDVFVRIPDGLSVDVLDAWLAEDSYLMAIVRDVELLGREQDGSPRFDDPEPSMFCREHRETAVAMIKAGVALDDERRAAK